MRVLLTGFQPFGGASANPSAAVAAALDGTALGPARIVAHVLPVRFGQAATDLIGLTDAVDPVLVLAMGQAEGRTELSFERIAVNLDDARIPDNAGVVRTDVPVVSGGPTAHPATLPVKAMVAAVRAADIPAGLSLSAGTFVCNHVFYALAHHVGGRIPQGFLHLPLMHEQATEFPGVPTMALPEMVRGVQIALTAALDVLVAPA